MHLVATVCHDPALAAALLRFRDPAARFLLHPVSHPNAAEILRSLPVLDFAGALLLDPETQAQAAKATNRRSLDASEVGAVDTVTVAPGGLIGEYNFGRALARALAAQQWDPRGATAVLLGSGPAARGIARELASGGVETLVMLAASRPEAEQALPPLAASTQVHTGAVDDARSRSLLERADLVVRLDEAATVPAELLGPHLTVVDLHPQTVTALRRQALAVGALTLNLRDVQAHLLALALSHILGGPIDASELLDLLHAA